MKRCTSCKLEKNESDFHRQVRSASGFQKQCKTCRNIKANAYYQNNKQKCKEVRSRWLSENREKERETKRLRRLRNKGTDKEEKRKVYSLEENKTRYLLLKQDPQQLENKRRRARKHEQKKRENILRKIENQIRCRTSIAIKGGPKIGKYEKYIGCTTEELKQHLESKFKPGMTWGNWGRGGWHIDHIFPVSSFNLSNPEQFFKAFHFTNLQPLWERENLSKGSKMPDNMVNITHKKIDHF